MRFRWTRSGRTSRDAVEYLDRLTEQAWRAQVERRLAALEVTVVDVAALELADADR